MIKLKKQKIYIILYLMFAIGLILSFNTVYIAQEFFKIYVFSSILCFMSIFLLIISKIKSKVNMHRLLFCSLVLFLDYIYIILRVRSLYGILILGIAFPIFIIFINIYYDSDCIFKIFNILIDFAIILAIFSLIYWIFGSILGIIKPKSIVSITWGNTYSINKYSVLYYTPQYANLSFFGIHIGTRNCSIFTEAPMASAFYCIMLLINEFYIKKSKKVINTLFCLTIISTLSITGWITLIIFSFYKMVQYKTINRVRKVIKIMITIIMVIIGIFFIYNLITNKLITGSGIDRAYHIYIEYNAFIDNPLFGCGFNSYTMGSSNSLFSIMADGGVVLLIIYYFPILGIIINEFIYNKKLDWFTIIFVIMFVLSVIQYTLITIFLISYSWVKFIDLICVKREKVKKELI